MHAILLLSWNMHLRLLKAGNTYKLIYMCGFGLVVDLNSVFGLINRGFSRYRDRVKKYLWFIPKTICHESKVCNELTAWFNYLLFYAIFGCREFEWKYVYYIWLIMFIKVTWAYMNINTVVLYKPLPAKLVLFNSIQFFIRHEIHIFN